MPKQCLRCAKGKLNPTYKLVFGGFTLVIKRRTNLYCDRCEIEMLLNTLNRCATKLFRRAKNKRGYNISWKKFVALEMNDQRALWAILSDLGFFTTDPSFGWAIYSQGLCLNPNPGVIIYFTNKADCRRYARAQFCHVVYSWYIQGPGKTMSKEEVLKR